MKIDGNRSAQDLDATRGTDAAQKVTDKKVAKKGEAPAAAAGDTVQVSSDAKLLAAALKATSEPTPVRTDVVEKMKQKLANGEIGNDAGRLADRLIDDLLKE